jgi:hypothetical protein
MNLTMSNLSLSAGVIFALVIVWRWQRTHPNFDLSDLLTGDNGKVSATKTIQTATWAFFTWGFVTMIQQGKMTEWYAGIYLGLAYGVKVAKDIYSKREETK